jgi:hypothetical protein
VHSINNERYVTLSGDKNFAHNWEERKQCDHTKVDFLNFNLEYMAYGRKQLGAKSAHKLQN